MTSPEGKLIREKLALIGPRLQTLAQNVSSLKTPMLIDVPEVNLICFSVLSEFSAVFDVVEPLCNECPELGHQSRHELKSKIAEAYSLAKDLATQIMSTWPPLVPLWLGKIEQMETLFLEMMDIAPVFIETSVSSAELPEALAEGDAVIQETGAVQETPEEVKSPGVDERPQGTGKPSANDEKVPPDKIAASETVTDSVKTETPEYVESSQPIAPPEISVAPEAPALSERPESREEKLSDGAEPGGEDSQKVANLAEMKKEKEPRKPGRLKEPVAPEGAERPPISIIHLAMEKHVAFSEPSQPELSGDKPEAPKRAGDEVSAEKRAPEKDDDEESLEPLESKLFARYSHEEDAVVEDSIASAVHDLQSDIGRRLGDLGNGGRGAEDQERQDIFLQIAYLEKKLCELKDKEEDAEKKMPGQISAQFEFLNEKFKRLREAWQLVLEETAEAEERESTAYATAGQDNGTSNSPEFMAEAPVQEPFHEELSAEMPVGTGSLPRGLPAGEPPAEGALSEKRLEPGDIPAKVKAEAAEKVPPVRKREPAPAKGPKRAAPKATGFRFLKVFFIYILTASFLIVGGMFLIRGFQPVSKGAKAPSVSVSQPEKMIPPAFVPFFTSHPKSLEKRSLNLFVMSLRESPKPESRKKVIAILKGWSWKGVPDVLLEIAAHDDDAQVSLAAFDAFKSITGYFGPQGVQSLEVEKWWNENRSTVTASLEDAD